MTRLAWTVMASFLVALNQTSQPLAGPQERFRASRDVVLVSVSVKRGDTAVRGLVASDFVLTDNGAAQDIELAEAEAAPLDLTLLLTGDGADAALAAEFNRSLDTASAARRLLGQKDRLRVVAARADVRGGFVPADAPLPPLLRRSETLGGIALTDALFFSLALPVPPDRRHVVLAFTDGWDTWSVLDTATLVPLVEHSDAVLSAAIWNGPLSGATSGGGISVAGSAPAVQRERERSYQVIERAVAASGGSILNVNGRDAARAIERLLRDFRESYLLRYSPRGAPAPGWHAIAVSLRQPNRAIVKARRGYFEAPR